MPRRSTVDPSLQDTKGPGRRAAEWQARVLDRASDREVIERPECHVAEAHHLVDGSSKKQPIPVAQTPIASASR